MAQRDIGATGDPFSTSLSELVADIPPLSTDERRQMIDQALTVVDQLYVHLPLKRAMHAVDPVQRLKLLHYRAGGMSDRQFHDEMLSIFTALRDMHTVYMLPAPYRRRDAVLPFRIQRYFESGRTQYIVTELTPDFAHEHFKPGVEVTHWNGTPIERAVEINAERNGGSNVHARFARGLKSMTQRPMAILMAPTEERVVIDYVSNGERRELAFTWEVVERPPAPDAVDTSTADERLASALGIDRLVEAVRRTQKAIFVPAKDELDRQTARGDGAPDPDLSAVSSMPDALQFRTVSTASGEFGYLRIRSFNVTDDPAVMNAFVSEVLRIVDLLPRNGLIIDVRGNGGGIIALGEILLQVFTPRQIVPERLHFLNTPLTLQLVSIVPWLERWRASMEQALEIGATFSEGFAIDPEHDERCNRIGQRYHGPVALLIDALCYSTTDIFAAGFQDHAIGPIVGTDACTGAGGANVWDHTLLRRLLPDDDSAVQPLPRDAGLSVAIRRTTRVGERTGDVLEDLGVVPEHLHELTREDLLNDNVDLIARAAALLAEMPVRQLGVTAERANDQIKVTVQTANITRLDAYVDGRPRHTLDLSDGVHEFNLSVAGSAPSMLEVRGFDGGTLVATRRMRIAS